MARAGGNYWTSSLITSPATKNGFTARAASFPVGVNSDRSDVSATNFFPTTTTSTGHVVDRTIQQQQRWKFVDSPMYRILANILRSANQPALFGVQQFGPPPTSPYENDTLAILQNGTLYANVAGNNNDSTFNSTDSNITRNRDDTLSLDETFDLTRLLLIIIAGTLLSLMTAGGNLLVLLSFKIDKQLRTISNYFLFSLGVADLTVGLVSIPLMTLYTAENSWTLGYSACQLWLSVDYLMSNASVCNLLLISFDRFFSLIRPLTYRPRRTKKKAFTMIALTFIISLVLWPPWIITWPYIEGEFAVADDECIVQFLKTNRWVTLGTAVLAFYLPVTIMVVLYAGVYYVTQTRHRELEKLQAFQKSKSRSGAGVAGIVGAISGGSGQRRSITDQNSQKFSEYSSLHQTDTYNEFSDSQAENNRVLGRTKSWGIQTLVDHFTRNRIRSSFFKRGSIISSGFEEESQMSSGDFPEEDTPLKQHDDQVTTAENRWKTRSNRRPNSRKKSAVQRLSSSVKQHHQQPIVASANIETPLIAGNNVAGRRSSCDGQRLDSVRSDTAPDDTDSTYTVLIHLTNSAQSRGPSITLYDDANSSPGSRSSLTPPAKSRLNHPSGGGAAATDELSKRRSVMSETADSVTVGGATASGGGRATESNSLKSKDSVPAGLLSLLPGTKLAQHGGSLGSASKRKQRAEKKQESKAAKTLSAILLAFIVTWTPYNVIVCVEAFWPKTVSNTWFTFSYYLCYINSTINPVLYALCNVNFKRCFLRILKCQWSKRHERAKDTSSLGYLLK